MREIKFRVWDKVDKEMMSPAKWEENYVGGGNKKIGLYIYRSRKDPKQHSSLDWVLRHPESFEVMQFTGLHDKNGKEIYEGDICLAALPKERFPVEVIWHDDKAGFLFQWDDATYESGKDEMEIDLFRDIEVIGNVHDNPELLEEQAK